MSQHSQRESGFTLVEIAVVLLISGSILYIMTQSFDLYMKNVRYNKTIENAKMSQEALSGYLARTGAYPCPANPNLSPNDPLYGVGQCRTFTNMANYLSRKDDCSGTPNGIVCPAPSSSKARDADNDGSADIVMIGVLPFRTISDHIQSLPSEYRTEEFSEAQKQDGYGRLFTYAVSESMTEANPENTIGTPANPYDGAIAVEDENEVSLTTPYASAHYVLISHGDNGKGGYTVSGALVESCAVSSSDEPPSSDSDSDTPTSSLDIEVENCENNDAVFVKTARSMGSNSNYYDDLLFYGVPKFSPLWEISTADGVPSGEMYIYNTNEGSTGIGVQDPKEELHILGSMNVGGNTFANGYCDGHDPNTCINTEDIGGEGSTCDGDNKVAYAISEGKLVCTEVVWNVPNKNCDANQYIAGISNKGTILCCPEGYTNKSECTPK